MAFIYDALGNRTQQTQGTQQTQYTSNNLNQYTQAATTNYTYDLNGNLTNNGEFSCSYDYDNRLASITKPPTEASYKYDAFGRRIAKTINNITTSFLYDGDQIIAEYDANNNLSAKYIYGPGIDEVISMEREGRKYYYYYDGLGSVINLVGYYGFIFETYSYDAFGSPSITSSVGNRFMFTGREFDSETGLYYYRARYYDPLTGRFLQRDPAGDIDSTNLYQYCLNNPINNIDPLGLYTLIIHGVGSHEEGYSGEIGESLKSSGEIVKEVIWWSGALPESAVTAKIKNEIKQAAEIAKARGESLNIISHSWGNVLVGDALNKTSIRVDNWVKMGSPYLSFIRPGSTARVLNAVDSRDPVAWVSLPFFSHNMYVKNAGESLFDVHNYWHNEQIVDAIFEMFDIERTQKK